MNIGRRPTFTGAQEAGADARYDESCDRVEIHILDLRADLYGEYLEVDVLGKHREEKKFASVDALLKQIHEDVAARRRYRLP